MIPYPGRQIPVSVVTGFLGAGKTTLLARLLRHPRFRRTAVVINEFGEVPLDHELVEAVEEDVVEISGGCLCCTVRGDLARAIGALDRRRRHDEAPAFERLLIETTGLADPAPILHTLMADPMIDDGYRLDGVIALVDAVTGLATLDRQPEAVKQLAMADRILVTKTDLTGDRIPVMLADRIAALAPTATVACANRGQIDPDRLFDLGPWRTRTRQADIECWLGEAARAHGHQHAHGHDPNRHGEAIRAFCLRRSDPVTTDALLLFLELLTGSAGPNLLRMKGIIRLAEEPARWCSTWSSTCSTNHYGWKLGRRPIGIRGWFSSSMASKRRASPSCSTLWQPRAGRQGAADDAAGFSARVHAQCCIATLGVVDLPPAPTC